MKKNEIINAFIELLESLFKKNIWSFMATLEIKMRYKRSILGEFWITLSTGIMLLTLGPLYSYLFNQTISEYFRYFAIGLIVWNFISTYVQESCVAFSGAASYIQELNIPYFNYIFKCLYKNTIIFSHNFILILIVLSIYPNNGYQNVLFIIPGIFIFLINLLWIGLLIAIISLRFRDIPSIVTVLMQISFFLTPVMWLPSMITDRFDLLKWNPFYQLLNLLRMPLLNYEISEFTWRYTLILFIIFGPLTFLLFSKYRSRLSYWL